MVAARGGRGSGGGGSDGGGSGSSGGEEAAEGDGAGRRREEATGGGGVKRDGGKRRQEETKGERTAGADGGSYGRGSGGSGLRWLGRQHFVRMVEAARVVAPRRAKVIRRRRLGRRRLGRWHPRSGVAPAGRTARPLSARAGAWSGVASGAAHRGGAVVAVVLGVAVIVQQRPQLHFVKRGSGAPCRFQATEGASRPSQIQTAAVKMDGVRSLAPPAGACHALVNKAEPQGCD